MNTLMLLRVGPIAAVLMAGIASLQFASLVHSSSATAAAPALSMATPTGADGAVQCAVKPRPLSELMALQDAPAGLLVRFAESVGTPFVRPIPKLDGVPAEPRVVAGVTETIESLYACGNAGTFLSLTALMTDDYLRRALGGLPAEYYASAATPVPMPEERRPRLIAIENVRVLPDGRIAATVRSDQSTSLNIFVENDGRFLIDDNFDITLVGTPTP